MSLPDYDATSEIIVSILITDPSTGVPIDPSRLAIVTRFVPTDPNGAVIDAVDIYGTMNSKIIKNSTGSYTVGLSTEAFVAGGEFTWQWFGQKGNSGSAQFTKATSKRINPTSLTDPFL